MKPGINKKTDNHFRLKLYVAGMTPISTRAIVNIKKFCDEFLNERYSLSVFDIYQQPELAIKHQFVATPTLIKEHPAPVRKLVGDLSKYQVLKKAIN